MDTKKRNAAVAIDHHNIAGEQNLEQKTTEDVAAAAVQTYGFSRRGTGPMLLR